MDIWWLLIKNSLQIEEILSGRRWYPPAAHLISNLVVSCLVLNDLPRKFCVEVVHNLLEQFWVCVDVNDTIFHYRFYLLFSHDVFVQSGAMHILQ